MSEISKNTLSIASSKAIKIQDALGKISVLAIGVTEYLVSSGFHKLKKCSDDAEQVTRVFLETPQLNANCKFIKHLTSATVANPPTRGLILHELKDLCASAQDGDRILFYFSGHGHRIPNNDDFFLVPQDAFDDESADAMVSFRTVMQAVQASNARQKLVIIDACLSGPLLLGKKMHAASYSEKFLADYVAGTRGIAILTSSEANEISYEKSNHPKLSLFTSFLVQALKGDPRALDDKFLTVASLFDFVSTEVKRACKSMRLHQSPTIDGPTSSGLIILGDFRPILVPNSPIDLKEHPISSLVLKDAKDERTKNILTQWRNRSCTIDQLEYAANQALGEHLENDFARYRSALRSRFKFGVSDLESDGKVLRFPNGSLSYHFKAKSKDLGLLHRKMVLCREWFADKLQLKDILDILEMKPKSFSWKLSVDFDPLKQIAVFEANGWQTTAEAEDKVCFQQGTVELMITNGEMCFAGIDFRELLDPDNKAGEQNSFISNALRLLPSP
jgi:hypothetical protein